MTSAFVLQVAILPETLRGPDGQPNLEGWAHLKHNRKKGMFLGIIGVPVRPQTLPYLVPMFAPGEELDALNVFFEGNHGAAPRGFVGVLEEVTMGEEKAELAERRAAAPEHQSLGFGGKLGMADGIVATFQLASVGKLGFTQRKLALKHLDMIPTQGAEPQSTPGQRLVALGDPGGPSQGDRGGPSGHSPAEDGVSGEGGNVGGLHSRRVKRARTTGERPSVPRESEESLHVTWPAWAGARETNYAVVVLDGAKVEEVAGYWQESGYPREDNAKGDAAEAACIVAAAHGKSQGLLLTVQEVPPDEYEIQKEYREDLYIVRYGKLPFRSLSSVERSEILGDEDAW